MSSLLSSILPRTSKREPRKRQPAPTIVRTSYVSAPVSIDDGFLIGPPKHPTQPMTTQKIDFAKTTLPEYENCYAVVMDGVLSPWECEQLIVYAQKSVPKPDGKGNDDEGHEHQASSAWQPAMVNAGPGFEVLDTSYRNSDRIVWDHGNVVARLWDRVCMDENVKEALKEKEVKMNKVRMVDRKTHTQSIVWKVTKLNERMRFLKYGKGQFFRRKNPIFMQNTFKTLTDLRTAHCDGAYHVPGKDERTFYTFHFYLNDSIQELRKGKEGKDLAAAIKSTTADNTAKGLCEGGATTFHSDDMSRRLDVDPKAGRVLIFQHKTLLHSGDDVLDGVKYTMRTDLQFEKVQEELGDSKAGLWENIQ